MSDKINYSLGLEEFCSKKYNIWKSTIGEFVGCFLINFFVCGAFSQPEDGTFKSLSFGLAVFVAITIVGDISGGHVNPAVTVAMLATGRVSLMRSIFYIAAQCLGAATATSAVKALLDEAYLNGLAHPSLVENISEAKGLGIEFCSGLAYGLTVFGATDKNKPDSRFTAPFAIGMSATLCNLGTIRYTGCGMNPARTFGTAFITNHWDYHWIYWAGPIMGGVVASVVYKQFLEKPEVPNTNDSLDKYRTHAFEREMNKVEKSSIFV